MKKVARILLYMLLIAGTLLALYRNAVYDFVSRMSASKEGVLVSVFSRVAQYFKDADALNLIFLVVFFCISLVAFVMVDSTMSKVFRWFLRILKVKYPFERLRWITITLQRIFSLVILGIAFILLCNIAIIGYGKVYSTDSPEELETGPVLVLGTRKKLSSGKGENLYYRYRIESAVRLWRLNKVAYFIASGDRSGDHYDETRDIMSDLVARGVPPERVKLDTAGYRTLDSMLRIREMYGTRRIVIVTQPFHAQRALFLAKFYGMDGIAFNARGSATMGMVIREFFSKPKVVLDLILFNMQPKVKVTGGSQPIQYREDFKVTSDLHVIFLLVLFIAVLSSLGLAYKYLD